MLFLAFAMMREYSCPIVVSVSPTVRITLNSIEYRDGPDLITSARTAHMVVHANRIYIHSARLQIHSSNSSPLLELEHTHQ